MIVKIDSLNDFLICWLQNSFYDQKSCNYENDEEHEFYNHGFKALFKDEDLTEVKIESKIKEHIEYKLINDIECSINEGKTKKLLKFLDENGQYYFDMCPYCMIDKMGMSCDENCKEKLWQGITKGLGSFYDD